MISLRASRSRCRAKTASSVKIKRLVAASKLLSSLRVSPFAPLSRKSYFVLNVSNSLLCGHRIDDLTPEEDKNEIVYNVNELRRLHQRTRLEETETGEIPERQTKGCCGMGKAKAIYLAATDKARRRGSIKQSGIISSIKKQPEKEGAGKIKIIQKQATIKATNIDPSDASPRSNSQKILLKDSVNNSAVGRAVSL